MMAGMKVSIVIPAYNEEKWVGKTLDAVRKINYPDFEVIVVDNASADKTSEVVEVYVKKDPRIKLIHEKRKGLLFAREAGRLKASGKILVQLDADCLPSPDWLSKGVKYFKDPEIVGVSGPYRLYDTTPAMRAFISTITEIGQKALYWPTSLIPKLRGKRAITVGGNFFIRAATLEKIGGYDTSIDFYSEDTDTGYRLSKYGKLLHKKELVIDSSARRFEAFGFAKLTARYIEAFLTIIAGKKLEDNREEVHPR